jgi:hypothetical protein
MQLKLVVGLAVIGVLSIAQQMGVLRPLLGPLTSSLSAAQALPMDPLMADEQRLAEQVAQTGPDTRSILGSTPARLVSTQLITVKPTNTAAERDVQAEIAGSRRTVELIYYLPAQNAGLRAIVDLASRSVTHSEPLAGRDVPLAREDIDEAWQLAQLSPDVQRAVALPAPDLVVQGLREASSAPSDPCYSNRCVRLLLRRGGEYLRRPIIVVDLTSRTVDLREAQP